MSTRNSKSRLTSFENIGKEGYFRLRKIKRFSIRGHVDTLSSRNLNSKEWEARRRDEQNRGGVEGRGEKEQLGGPFYKPHERLTNVLLYT